MPSRSTLWLATIMVLAIAVSVHAQENDICGEPSAPPFSATLGLDVSFVPVPPATFDIISAVHLSLTIGEFAFDSRTRFALSGFQSQRFDAALHLGSVTLSDWIEFDPGFAWNQFTADAQFHCIGTAIHLILANIGSPQTPTYSMAAVLDLRAEPLAGLSVLSLTGFGAVDLIALHGGAAAPFTDRLLYLFHYLDGLCAPEPDLRVTVLPGFYFEEQLLRLEFDLYGLLASSTTVFDWLGFAHETLEVGFGFLEPDLAFLMSLTFNSFFAIDAMEFVLDLAICPVAFTSWTSFVAPPPPSPVAIAFAGQRFALGVEAIGVLFTLETDFDGSFLFQRQIIALETEIPPVRFSSRTTFIATGFEEQCLAAEVQFIGVELFSRVAFDLTGITLAQFGFALTF
jgi:hypothetical protein